jgi:hypothetical protein
VEYMKPDWWQKALRLGKSADHGDRWKAHLKERAQALFPRVEGIRPPSPIYQPEHRWARLPA